MGASREQTPEEKKEEQERRLAEQAKWTAQQQWFSNFYSSDRHVKRFFWERVEGERSEDELKDLKERQASQDQAFIGSDKESTYRVTDGLFRATADSGYVSRETRRNFFIELKDGEARPRPPLRESEFASHQSLYMEKFNAVYGQIMDFMAVQCGYSKLIIDLPDMSPLMSQYDHMRLNAMMDLAKERGLHLSFGPTVMERLKDRPNEYAQYTDRLNKLNAQSAFSVKNDAMYKNDYQLATKSLGDKERKGAPAFGEAFDTRLNEKNNDIEKLEIMNEALGECDTRLNALKASYDAVDKNISDFEARVEGLSTQDTRGDLRAYEKGKPRPHGNEEGNEKAIASAERYIANVEKERADLIEAMKRERDELQARRESLQSKYDSTVSNYEFRASKDGKPLSEEQTAAYKGKCEAVKGRLEKLNTALGQLDDAAMQRLQVERVEALKAKVEERKRALEEAKKALR